MNEVKDACNTTFEEYIVKVNKIQDYEKMKRREKDLGN